MEIDLECFAGDVIDVSDSYSCRQHCVWDHTRAHYFAVKHKVVMLLGYIHPSRLSKPLQTSELRPHNLSSWPSFDDFLWMLSERARRQLNDWRRPAAACRKSETPPSSQQALCNDDKVQAAVLKQAAEQVSKDAEQVRQDIAKLEARKAALEAQEVVLDSLLQQVQKRVKDRARKLEEEERERQRQEELKRKRQEEEEEEEEEERCEEEGQAEKRRKQLEWQAQEQRGPRIWARCAANNHLLKNFDRTALQVALGQSGYITLWDYVKGHAWCGIPTRLYNKLNGGGIISMQNWWR